MAESVEPAVVWEEKLQWAASKLTGLTINSVDAGRGPSVDTCEANRYQVCSEAEG